MSDEQPKTETEILGADDEKLRAICRSLKKTEAPDDFDLQLKARIANAKPRDFEPRFGFAFRFAVPALALILVVGLLAYTGGFWSSQGGRNIAGNPVEAPGQSLPQNTAAASVSAPDAKSLPDENAAVPAQDSPKPLEKPQPQLSGNLFPKAKKDFRGNKKEAGGGSNLFSSTGVKVEQPKIIELKNPPPNPERSVPITVKEVLSTNGINADFENGKWTVRSVTANSLGESSGVRESDVIEAIDEQPLSAETSFNRSAGGKTITVTRGGAKLVLKLRNKQ